MVARNCNQRNQIILKREDVKTNYNPSSFS